jgi:hypothetical protein
VANRAHIRRYEQRTRPLADHHAQSGRLRSVAAEGTPEAILERTLVALHVRVAGEHAARSSGIDRSSQISSPPPGGALEQDCRSGCVLLVSRQGLLPRVGDEHL